VHKKILDGSQLLIKVFCAGASTSTDPLNFVLFWPSQYLNLSFEFSFIQGLGLV
jgi:hypothetical protein